MDKELEAVKNTTEPLASLEYNIRKAHVHLAHGQVGGLIYLVAAIVLCETIADQGGRVEYDG